MIRAVSIFWSFHLITKQANTWVKVLAIFVRKEVEEIQRGNSVWQSVQCLSVSSMSSPLLWTTWNWNQKYCQTVKLSLVLANNKKWGYDQFSEPISLWRTIAVEFPPGLRVRRLNIRRSKLFLQKIESPLLQKIQSLK